MSPQEVGRSSSSQLKCFEDVGNVDIRQIFCKYWAMQNHQCSNPSYSWMCNNSRNQKKESEGFMEKLLKKLSLSIGRNGDFYNMTSITILENVNLKKVIVDIDFNNQY